MFTSPSKFNIVYTLEELPATLDQIQTDIADLNKTEKMYKLVFCTYRIF